MSLVFDQNWIAEFSERYARRPRYQQPALYRLATHSAWADERQKIERSVSLLPPDAQQRVITSLRNPDQFFTTLNELRVGDWLRNIGYSPEYERPLEKQTPDWYVPAGKVSPEFLVEVATILPPKVVQDEQRLWQELRDRLEDIEHYFHLWIGTGNTAALKGRNLKPIIRFVREWLDQFDPSTTHHLQKTTYRDGNLEIEFQLLPRKSTNRKSVATAGPIFSQMVNIELLRGTVSKKINKYKKAKDLKIPLLVAIAPTFDSGFDEDTLMDVLFGREHIVLATGELNRDRTGLVMPKNQGGQPVVFNTRLSAVIWIDSSDQSKVKIVHNPYARTPVPIHAFPGVPNFSVLEQDKRRRELGWITP